MAVANKLAPTSNNKPKVTFTDYIAGENIKKKINEMVGGKNSQRFITAIVSAVSNRKDAQGKEYWEKVAQFQLGYKGYIQLAIRSNFYTDLDVLEVREGEYLGRDKNTGKHRFSFITNEEERNSKPVVGYLAYFEYSSGFTKTLYWTKTAMENHAITYSKAYAADRTNNTRYSFWTTKFDDMAFKTMIRQLISRWGIMSIDMQKAFERDMAVIEENENYEYVDNEDLEEESVIVTPVQQETKQQDPADAAVDQFFNQ